VAKKTRISANGGVISGEVVRECGDAHCRVRIPNVIIEKRTRTYGYVAATGGIAGERGYSVSRVVGACSVAHECVKTDACVAVAGSVALERVKTGGRVLRTSGIAKERVHANGRVAVASGVSAQRIDSVGGVEAARGVDEKVKRSVSRVGESRSVA